MIKNPNFQRNKKVDQNEVARMRGAHIPDGFPHYSHHSGLCMCLASCCMGANGCRCKGCICQQIPEWHTDRSPLPLTLVDTNSSIGKGGITNG